jgi:hypothetical protein
MKYPTLLDRFLVYVKEKMFPLYTPLSQEIENHS